MEKIWLNPCSAIWGRFNYL